MTQGRIPAVFMRGGTSKGVFFKAHDLPPERAAQERIFLAALGSPDPYGRQLNGLGGGISSLSKAVIVAPSAGPDAELDYTFAQIAIDRPVVDWSTTCGNLSAAVGPFALESGLIAAAEPETILRIRSVNTGKIFRAHIPVKDGRFEESGDCAIPGVSGSGSEIRLDYLDCGGATTGRLLPSGRVRDTISLPGDGDFEVSLVDASTAVVFVAAERLGLRGTETVAELETNTSLLALLERLRRAAAQRMGLVEHAADAALGNPRIGIVAPMGAFQTLSGERLTPADAHLAARIVSVGQVHRALPLTGAMCLAVACRIEGTNCHEIVGPDSGVLRLANPSGVLPVTAEVRREGDAWRVDRVTVTRTARALMEGAILLPETALLGAGPALEPGEAEGPAS